VTLTSYTDALGRQVTVKRPPERIVSLVPSITEALFAFGLGDRVAGITRFCVEPREGVKGKPKVGGTKNVDVGKAAALAPDLVIANVEENVREDIEALEAAGLIVFMTYPRNVRQAIDELRLLAEMTGGEAGDFLTEAEGELAAASDDVRTPVRVFCPIWRNPWMTIGRDTYMHDLLALCGGENVFSDATDRYPEVTLDEAAARAPDVVLLPDEPFRFGKKHVPEVIERMPNARIYLVDGKLMCWYGPRIPAAIRMLRELLRPEGGA
jgi:ABC-type Fe3+-hydroxamate transport system substrate-binding protein